MADQQSSPPPSQAEQDALIALMIAPFLLSQQDIQRMADAIYAGLLAALLAAYADVASAVTDGADDGSDFEPPQDVLDKLRAEANQRAQQIAQTYERDLKAAASGFLAGWLASHDNSLVGAKAALKIDLAAWAKDRAHWKALQIARAETGEGFSVGTLAGIDDAINGILELAEELTLEDIRATVLPEEAAEEFCMEFAGNEYTIEDAQDLIGLFPAHLNCPHEVVIYVA